MKLIKYFLIKAKDSNMMPIERVDFELEALVEVDLIFEASVDEVHKSILVISEICSVECLEVDFDEVDQEEKPKEMIWKSRLKSVLKRLFWE